MKNSFKKIMGWFLVLTLFANISPEKAEAKKPELPASYPIDVIVLDPGHGGTESGAVNREYGLLEKNLNFQIAQIVGNKLRAKYGDSMNVLLTRTDDSTKSNNDRYTFANNNGGDLLVSIHLNSSTNSAVDYTMTMYGKRNKDLAFAKVMQAALYAHLTSQDSTIHTTYHNCINFASGVLLKSNMPAVMTESVFMSNPTEAAALKNGIGLDADQSIINNTRQAQIAQGIYEGIVAWIER